MLGEECLAQRAFQAGNIGFVKDLAAARRDPCRQRILFISAQEPGVRLHHHDSATADDARLSEDDVRSRLCRDEFSGEVTWQAGWPHAHRHCHGADR